MRWVLVAFCLVWNAGAAPAPFRFAEATIDGLQAEMAAGRLTAQELTAAYLQRIAEIDQSGPMLRAVIEVNPDALGIAAQLDGERKAGKVRGPLHGIPVLIKDNIATADRMETTAGSLALVGARPGRDAFLVARLRKAGAVVLGKTNLSEWALFRDGEGRSGWSGRGGQTLNPYALDRSPSGSSSGAAVAVSANLCVVAVGTETDGSIVSPASACGVVGMKPTVGLISRSGIIPISSSQDTPGAVARTVRDAALLLSAMAGTDPEDPATRASGRPRARALGSINGSQALKGVRIGVVTGPFGFDARMDHLLDEKVAELQAAGARVVCWGELPVFRELDEPEREVLLYEFKDGINRYLASLGPSSPVKSLGDLIAYNDAHADTEMPYFKQQIFLLAQTKGPLSDRAYRSAVEACRRYSRTEGIDRLMQLYRLDVLVSLTGSPAGRIERVDGGPAVRHSAQPAAVAGYPSVTVPAGQIDGLPVGLSFFGRAWTEARLLECAADFEARTRARRPPEFLPYAREDSPPASPAAPGNRPSTPKP